MGHGVLPAEGFRRLLCGMGLFGALL